MSPLRDRQLSVSQSSFPSPTKCRLCVAAETYRPDKTRSVAKKSPIVTDGSPQCSIRFVCNVGGGEGGGEFTRIGGSRVVDADQMRLMRNRRPDLCVATRRGF
jgi:hypothetical protein